jgi:predicted HicB family RNase H-like nuclease
MAEGKPGAPPGTVNNPKGTNQYASGKGEGQKDARLMVVLSHQDKLRLKEAAKRQGMSLSSWILEVALEATQASGTLCK